MRKLYFFPIRCNIKFYNETSFKSSDGKTRCKGIFFEGDEKEFPSIVFPLKLTSKYLIEDAMFNLTSLLTYYFQWYFFEDKNRTHRSLEIEATQYSNCLVFQYLESMNDTDYTD